MKTHSILLAACLAFVATASGAPTTSSHASTTKTSSLSTQHSTTASTKTSSSSSSSKTSTSTSKSATPSATSVATTYDINFDERTVNPVLPLLNAVGVEDTISFDLHSFYFGCAGNTAEGAASAAVECTILFAGFRNGQEVVDATYTFSPPMGGETAAAPLVEAVLPAGFVTLQNVTIVQGDPTVDVLNADDFVVTTHT
ncbi:MAG: hypothetical protein ASARMPRED_003083 [Alectoria sarmentosa]|nr:MAG: hypothetical protein ASARMPRED_003083 [Alectoria sarmentosa]